MGGIRRAAANSQDKEPAAPGAHVGEKLNCLFAQRWVQFRDDFRSLAQMLFGVAHGVADNCCARSIASSSASPSGEPISKKRSSTSYPASSFLAIRRR